ncbi:methyltransferase domain-containing protein [Inquilinus sp. CAU 1745]|uniref:methyltransferase domain-containing protein n=1 Tax=Inquilinus sp. CAU 1745 TaxID=3140369 RepID=UPI00325B30B3
MGFKRRIPWWGKIGAKLVLSRLPASYGLWQRLGLFRHGDMDEPGYALRVFDEHVAQAGLSDRLARKTILELGPGDSVAAAIIARARGARAILVDVGPFAKAQPETYGPLVHQLREAGLNPPTIEGMTTLRELIEACEASYLTEGLTSLRELPESSVDLVYSQAVLEHVRKREFVDIQRELFRILKDDGVCSHQIDLRDHLGGSLNNLRFSEQLWESDFFSRSGFYTNRINFEAMAGLFRQAGFEVEVGEMRRWKTLPINRHQLATVFREISEETLCVSGFDVLLRRASR